MACSHKHCSGCGSCCRHNHAHVDPEYCSGNTYCSGCSGCSGYGVLRTVAGPYNRPGPGYPGYPNPCFPFYTGPCGPCEKHSCGCGGSCSHCGCSGCTGGCTGCSSCESSYDGWNASCGCNSCAWASGASFAAAAPVNLAAGDCVGFSCTSENAGGFTATGEGIRIRHAGCYMVVYTVHVPANETVSSRFLLTLNGDRIASSAADVSSIADGSTNGYTMHALVHVPADSLLKLTTLGPVSVCSGPASNVFTLSICKIG